MKVWQLIFGLGVLFFSCTKSNDPSQPEGLYTEQNPVPGRSQLNFIGKDLMVKIESGTGWQDSFRYSLIPGKILLKPVWTDVYKEQEFAFKHINDSSFIIDDLFPRIPEMPATLMTFKK